MLHEGFYDVPAGHVATIVTYLEMTAPPSDPRASRGFPDGVTLEWQDPVAPDAYLDLFRRVGGVPWLWWSRLELAPDALAEILTDPKTHVGFVMKNGRAEGLLELDFRAAGACELAYFGLTEALIGSGAGRALMDAAISRAFAADVARFHVHTCTLDSPQALGFYRRSGFTPVKQQVEIAQDPRLQGQLPMHAGPRTPIYPV